MKKTTVTAHHPDFDVPMNQTRYDNLCTDYGKAIVDDYIERVKDWRDGKGEAVVDFAATASNWIKRDNIEKKRKHKVCPECSKEYIGTLCIYCGYEEGKG